MAATRRADERARAETDFRRAALRAAAARATRQAFVAAEGIVMGRPGRYTKDAHTFARVTT
jgi:hypothetical protein